MMSNLDKTRKQDKRHKQLSNGNNGVIIRIDDDGNCLFRAIVEACKYLEEGTNIANHVKDHLELRKKISKELKKEKYAQLIKNTLSDEKGVSVNLISSQDIEAYITNISKSGSWGGAPEAHVIAHLLHIRITIHQDGQIIKIPQGNEYDDWEESIEVIHESVNAGLSNKDVDHNNHYNLIVAEELSERIFNDNYISHPKEDLRTEIGTGLTPDGLKKSLHGNMYQLGLLTLAALRAERAEKAFYLITEAAEYEKFDDLVIDYGESITFLQAKHSSGEGQYSDRDFCSDPDGDASLAKYFDSWYILRDSQYSKTLEGNLKKSRYVFFTNRGVSDWSSFLESVDIPDDDFLFTDLKTQTLRFKKGGSRERFIDAIRANSKKIKIDNHVESFYINIDNYQKDIKDAVTYLNKNAQKNIKINSNNPSYQYQPRDLTQKQKALLSLALEDEKYKDIFLKYSFVHDLIINKKIKVIISNPMAVLTLPIQKEINLFLDEFIIKVEQPNSDTLANVIARELRVDINIAATEFYAALNNYMLRWFTDRKNCLLRSEDLKEFVEIETANLQRFYLLGGTKEYKKESESDNINYQLLGKLNGLKSFIVKNKSKHIAIIEDNGGGIKQKIYTTISVIENLKEDEWSYLDLINSEYLSILPKVILGSSTKFLIIDCRTTQEAKEKTLEFLHHLCKTTIERGKKLILLIRTDQKNYIELLGKENHDKFKEFIVDPLNDQQIQAICGGYNEYYISLGEKQYQIKDIIERKLGSIYELMRDVHYLEQIVKVSSPDFSDYEHELPYSVYIPNHISKGTGYYDLSIITRTKVKIYIIENIEYSQLLEALNKLFKERNEPNSFSEAKTEDTEAEFILIKDHNEISKYPSKTIILIKKPEELETQDYLLLRSIDRDGLLRLQIIENPLSIILPFPEGVDYSQYTEQEQFIESISTNSCFSVLMSPAGYGKTSFCNNVIYQHKQSLPADISAIWKIKISLPKLQFNIDGDPILTALTNINYEWQYKTFIEDSLIQGRVLIILDGFDEIKDIRIVSLINNWIKSLPRTVSLLITTREYAANKLVILPEQSVTFYKLDKYTEDQRNDYINKFIKAILGDDSISNYDDSFISNIAEKILLKLNEHSVRVLGIPLESYIFCELLKPHILLYVEKNGYQLSGGVFDEYLEKLDISNTANLYQEFLLSKYMLFLEKHLGVKKENIIKKGMIFNLMGAYNQVIELFALKQAFNLNGITKFTYSIHFDMTSLSDLKDTGLLSVSEDNSRFSFNHETYQEFYAAVAIVRGLISCSGELYEEIKKVVQQNRYDPKYYFIFSIASQLSLSSGYMMPGYNIERHLVKYWEILSDDGDIIGAGAVRLFANCITELREEQIRIVLDKLEDKKWIKLLEKAISQKEQKESYYLFEHDDEALPIVVQNADEDDVQIDMSKSGVVQSYKHLRKKAILNSKHIEELENEAGRHVNNMDYWALDGGIAAIGETGRFFSEKLASYLLLRAKCWDNNEREVIYALRTIFRSLKNEDIEAKFICFDTIQTLLSIDLNFKSNKRIFLSLLYQVFPELIDYFKSNLNKELQNLKNDLNIQDYQIYNPSSIFDPAFKIIKNILLLAEKLEHAVLIEEDHLILVKDTKTEVKFKQEENVLNQIFARALFKALIESYNLESNFVEFELTRELEDYTIIERLFIKQFENEQVFVRYFSTKGNHKDIVGKLFKLLAKYDLITKYKVMQLIEATTSLKQSQLFWDNDGGIEAVGYTGIFFSDQLSLYLKRIRDWSNNIEKAIKSLERICKTIEKTILHDEDYHSAVRAYNNCIKCSKFSQLEPIEILDKATQTEEDNNIGGNGYSTQVDLYKKLPYISSFYNKYYKNGIDEILILRIQNTLIKNIALIPAIKLNKPSIDVAITKAIEELEKGYEKVIIPCNIEGKHWVGIIIETESHVIKFTYLDAEQNGMYLILKDQIIECSQVTKRPFLIEESSPEKQKYNNCGPELIENFVYYLTATRATQENAIYLHSLLYETSLLNQEYSYTKIEENNLIISYLSNQFLPIYLSLERADVLDYYIIKDQSNLIENSIGEERATFYLNYQAESANFEPQADIFYTFLTSTLQQLDLNWQVQKLLHLTDLWKFEALKTKYGITASFDAFIGSNSDFRKSILFKLHPDKNLGNDDCNDDFIFVTNLREKLNKSLDIQGLIDEKIQSIQPMIYKANMGFKVIDIALDVARLLYIPTIDNVQKTLIDFAHIYSMYTGINGYSVLIAGYDVIYKFYEGEYTQALSQATTSISYALLPTMMASFGIPHIGFTYSVGLAIYGGVNTIANIQLLYNEFNQKDFKLNSNIAYQNLVEALSTTFLQNFYDFIQKAKECEKTAFKVKLEEKGEFGQKLYEYIYAPVLEEKYVLLNLVVNGELTEEQAKSLKAKHVKISLESQIYQHCTEIRNVENDRDAEQYYCYNEEQQILDHIAITGDGVIEIMERL
jgi:uncharacterized protein YehS (DUF1456 family)